MSSEGVERRLEHLRQQTQPPTWTCPHCGHNHWTGNPDDGCDNCGVRDHFDAGWWRNEQLKGWTT